MPLWFGKAYVRFLELDSVLTKGQGAVMSSSNALRSKPMKLSPKRSLAPMTPVLLVIALVAVGCGSTPKPKVRTWTIKITKVTPASIEVDLLGVNKSEDSYWRSVSVSKYWQPNSPLRREAESRAKSTRFEGSREYVLSKDDPIWAKWFGYGAYELMVIANLPGSFSDGAADPRRLFVPLDKAQWPQAKDQTLELEISENQVRVLTPQRP